MVDVTLKVTSNLGINRHVPYMVVYVDSKSRLVPV